MLTVNHNYNKKYLIVLHQHTTLCCLVLQCPVLPHTVYTVINFIYFKIVTVLALNTIFTLISVIYFIIVIVLALDTIFTLVNVIYFKIVPVLALNIIFYNLL